LIKNNSYWIFKVASRPEVGGGHMMRCISLARVFSKHTNLVFILDTNGEYWVDILKKYGLKWEFGLNSINNNCVGVLVDDYDCSENELLNLKMICGKLAVMNDNNALPNFVDYAISANNYEQGNFRQDAVLMYGVDFALLAPEYSNSRIIKNCDKVKKIFINCGLLDSADCVHSVLSIIENIGYKESVTVAIGSNAPHLKMIENNIRKYSFKINLIVDSYDLLEFMAKADLIIGSGGMSMLERMSLGKPSVTVIVANNQLRLAKWSDSVGATMSIEHGRLLELEKSIRMLLYNQSERKKMSKIAKKTVDGMGVYRVTKVLLS
jgi:UDP-2,4-diacetamido-2,4,6-trideoxy-beta-L-altropyranose hydrolase